MTKVEIAILFLFSLFLVAMPIRVRRLPETSPLRPLCASQFNLVNYACGTLQVAAQFSPPSSSDSSSSSSHGSSSSQGHSSSSSSRRSRSRERRHRHSRRQGHGTDAQGYCCQWLNQLDTECVCDVLVHLPVFLSRSDHQYIVVVGNACRVSFRCPGRLAP